MPQLRGLSEQAQGFHRGINDRLHPSLIGVDELASASNVDITSDGLRTRDGYITYANTADTTQIDGLYSYRKNDGSIFNLRVSNGKVYREDAGSWTQIYSGLTAGVKCFFKTFRDVCLISNGTDKILKYDGSYIGTLEVPPPGSPTLSIVEGAGTLTNGDYRYKLTFVTSLGPNSETNASAATFTITTDGGNDAIEISNIPTSPDPTVIARNIYRRLDGTDTDWYYVATINDNITTNFRDDNITTTKDTSRPAPTDNNAPKIAKFVAGIGGYLVTANEPDYPNRVRFSRAGGIEFFPDSPNVLDVLTEGNDEITGLVAYDQTVIVFSRDAIHRSVGSAAFDFVRLPSNFGCIAPGSATEVDRSIVFMSQQGLAALSGNYPEVISQHVKSLNDDFNFGNTDTVSATFLPRERKYYMSFPSNQSETNNKILVADFRYGEVSRPSIYYYDDITASSMGILYTDEGRDEVAFGTYVGVTNLLGFSPSDNGTAISWEFEPKTFNFNFPSYEKTFNNLILFGKDLGEYDLTLNHIADDLEETNKTATHTFTNRGGKTIALGANLGSDFWVSPKGVVKRSITMQRGNHLRVKISGNTVNQQIGIFGILCNGSAPVEEQDG